MEANYSRDVDILMLRLSEESNGIIAHFSSEGKPVLLEIQGARAFLLTSITSLVDEKEVRLS